MNYSEELCLCTGCIVYHISVKSTLKAHYIKLKRKQTKKKRLTTVFHAHLHVCCVGGRRDIWEIKQPKLFEHLYKTANF